MVREDDKVLNKTTTYSYDKCGNITSRVEYPYTTGTLGTATDTCSYGYDTTWKDLMTNFDGYPIVHDNIGNPTSYKGYTYTWQMGRQLAGISGNGIAISYKYNESGIRTQKVVKNTTTNVSVTINYQLSGDKVIYEENGIDKIYYTYGSGGTLVSMNLNGVEYYYIKNLQGDIIGLFDTAGTQVASYVYDSWGRLISIKNQNGTDITNSTSYVGNKNPYRYRGYRYDNETWLYYLQSRYYNPVWGRFLNVDGIAGKFGNLLSHNMFAYCENNVINCTDPTGYMVYEGTGGGGGSALGGAAALEALFAPVAIILTAEVFEPITSAITSSVLQVGQSISSKSKTLAKDITQDNREEKSTTNLYRAMDYVEYNRLNKYGRFSSNAKDKPWVMDTKWFATNVADANTWGKKLNPNGYKIVEVKVPTVALSGMYYNQFLDGIGPAYNATVPYINSVIIVFRTVK